MASCGSEPVGPTGVSSQPAKQQPGHLQKIGPGVAIQRDAGRIAASLAGCCSQLDGTFQGPQCEQTRPTAGSFPKYPRGFPWLRGKAQQHVQETNELVDFTLKAMTAQQIQRAA
jgi:hypothetical protein